jgi:Kef-type K+ transport system membrane component KefB
VQTPDSSHLHGTAIFATHFGPALHSVLKPFFFASIGFSIPISRMFSGSVVWRGVVYSILMIIAKLLCGLCLIRFTSPVLPTQKVKSLFNMRAKHLPWPLRTKGTVRADQQGSTELTNATTATTSRAVPSPQGNINKARSGISRPLSLYPSALLGFAMVARGEIGFLISAIAESEGVFSGATNANNDEGSSELFLVVTWAILLCTLLGPIVVGTLVRRVQRLQKEQREKKTGRGDPLGIWGVLPPAAAAAAAS